MFKLLLITVLSSAISISAIADGNTISMGTNNAIISLYTQNRILTNDEYFNVFADLNGHGITCAYAGSQQDCQYIYDRIASSPKIFRTTFFDRFIPLLIAKSVSARDTEALQEFQIRTVNIYKRIQKTQ